MYLELQIQSEMLDMLIKYYFEKNYFEKTILIILLIHYFNEITTI